MSESSKPNSKLSLWIVGPGEGNPLKHFLAWRRQTKSTGGFAFAHADTTLHRNLELRDNFFLALGESPSSMPWAEKDQYVKNILEREGLSPLLRWLPKGPAHLSSLTHQERIIASLCHAFLQRADLTLLDLREATLSELCRAQLHQVLSTRKGHVVIAAPERETWNPCHPEAFHPCTPLTFKKVA